MSNHTVYRCALIFVDFISPIGGFHVFELMEAGHSGVLIFTDKPFIPGCDGLVCGLFLL